MDPKVAFLRARLDEDEARYRAAAGDAQHQRWALTETGDLNEGYIVTEALRALREVEAKRRILDYAERNELERWGGLLPALALPYSDHPDYDPSWRP